MLTCALLKHVKNSTNRNCVYLLLKMFNTTSFPNYRVILRKIRELRKLIVELILLTIVIVLH